MPRPTPYTRPETYFFLAMLIVIGVLVFLVFLPFLSTIVLAGTFAVLVYPVHKRVLKVMRGQNVIASLVTIIGLFFLIIVPLYLIAAQVFTEATSSYYRVISENSPLTFTVDSLQSSANSMIGNFFPGITINLHQYITSASAWALQNVGNFFAGTISVGLRLFLGVIALFYFVKDGRKFLEVLYKYSPIPIEHTNILVVKMKQSIRSIIGGSLVVALIQGLVSGIGFTIFGIPNPALWGTLTVLAALVPGVGTSLVLVPVIIYAFVAGSVFQGIGMGIWAMFAVGLIDNFLSPKIIGGGLKIHPLVILFSIIGGLEFFGPEGFILGPLAVSLFVALFGIYKVIVKTENKVIENVERIEKEENKGNKENEKIEINVTENNLV